MVNSYVISQLKELSMSRMFASLVMAALFVCPAAHRVVCAAGPYLDPGAFGQQVEAQVADGELTIIRTVTSISYETVTKTKTRTRVVEVDGEKREESITVEVPVTVPRMEARELKQKLPLAGVQAFDMQGKRVDGDQLGEALKEPRTVLLASRKVPRYYLTIYKPDTLLLVATPQAVFAAPAAHGAAPLAAPIEATPRLDPPKALAAPVVPARPEAAPKLDDPKPDAPPKADGPQTLPPPTVPAPAKPDAPRPLPAPAAVAPPVLSAPALSGTVALAGSSLQEPLPSIARIVDDKLGLRRYVKDVSSETGMREVEQDGVKKLAPFSVEVESITDVERKYPQSVLKIYRADGKPLADDELAKLKDTERCVLVSSDGKDVDARYLKIVKPETLIVVPPSPPMPFIAPTPIGTPLPLKLPVPAAP
jgi:hypothetical protein